MSFVLWSRVGPQLAIGELRKSVYNLSKRGSHPKKSRKQITMARARLEIKKFRKKVSNGRAKIYSRLY